MCRYCPAVSSAVTIPWDMMHDWLACDASQDVTGAFFVADDPTAEVYTGPYAWPC